ncbi:MAG: TIGR03862 family flavoprotein, partial [Rubrivivax sp.]
MDGSTRPSSRVAVIGGGPAGLMAAERLTLAGHSVDLHDAMPSVGRKFLLAGKGGLNLTHSDGFERFVSRYGPRQDVLSQRLQRFDADALRAWASALGVDTFIGTSGRVFPSDLKAAPLLRAWLHRLRGQGVAFHMRHRWRGFGADGRSLCFDTPDGPLQVQPAATVLALGGASWPQLGSDGAWVPHLQPRGVEIAPLRPSNCGFDVDFSDHLRSHHAGEPIKSVALRFGDWQQTGEFVLTESGVEGSLIYAASAALRDAIDTEGQATFTLDLLPARSQQWVQDELAHPRGPRSLSTHLKTRLKLSGAKAGLLWEWVPKDVQADPARFAASIKALPITVTAARPVDEAISTAGGVRFEAVDERLMLKALP